MSEIKETAPASPAALNAPSAELTLVAERLLRRPDRFESLFKKHLDAHGWAPTSRAYAPNVIPDLGKGGSCSFLGLCAEKDYRGLEG